MSEDRQKLKHLLISEEIAQIEALRKLLEDQNKFAQKVSDVLDQATDLTIKKNPRFQKKFSKIDSKSFARHIKANKQTFIDALLPIIGPMIRQSVTNAIRRFVADVNRAMEMGFSAKALKWRWQAITTGVPFAELVFNNTIQYQVQQIFLIDNETGLLIEYAGQEDALLQDKDAMSAMLTAIQDFVKDSIDHDSEGLSAAELGDNLLWLIRGSHANLAVVVKGAPTSRLRDRLTDACEEIHADFSEDLENQEKWNNNPELKVQLEQLLLTKTQSDDQEAKKSINWWPWIIIILAIFSWLFWSQYQKQQSYQQHLEILSQSPGFVLQNFAMDGDHYIATGLKDPDADLSHLPTTIKVNSTPFISLDDRMISSRVVRFLSWDKVQISVENGHVTLTGNQPELINVEEKVKKLALLPGVRSVDNRLVQPIDLAQELAKFLQENPAPEKIHLSLNQDTIIISGQAVEAVANPFITQVNNQFSVVDKSSLAVFTSEQIISNIANSHLQMINPTTLTAEQNEALHSIADQFKLLTVEQASRQLKLLPRSDCQGTIEKSNSYMNSRAQLVRTSLLDAGLTEDEILTEINYCEQSTEVVNIDMLGVWFEVVE
jgi:hypothetical protein